MGTIVLVGHGPKDVTIDHATFVQILRKQLSLVGSWNSDFTDSENDWLDSVKAIAEKKIDPAKIITHKIPLEESAKVFELIGNRTEFYNKITVVM